MQRIVLVYGIIAGLVIIGSAVLSLEAGIASTWLGFLIMFIAFSTIFLAVKSTGTIRWAASYALVRLSGWASASPWLPA